MVQTHSQPKATTKTSTKAPKTGTTKSASTKSKATGASQPAPPLAPKVITKKAKGDTKKTTSQNTFEGSALQTSQKTSQNTVGHLNSNSINGETRHRMISELAYSFAEKRNFCCGNAVSDWLAAEAIVDEKINR